MTTDSLALQFNDNHLQTTKFSVTIEGLPFASYFCQELTIPGVSTSEAQVPSPYSDYFFSGDKLVYDYLTLTFIVDEDLRVWEETFNWLNGITYPLDSTQYAKQEAKGIYHDAIVILNTNNNSENVRFKFRNCHPVSLGPMSLSFKGNALNPIIADLTLRYDTYIIERIATT